MTASQWFGRYGWFAILSLLVPGLASAPWLHFVNRDAKMHGGLVWCWSTVAAAVVFGLVVYIVDQQDALFFAPGADVFDHVVGLYICGAIATATVVLLTVLFALSPVFDLIFGILRIFD